jgi:hypothetical protein
MYIIPKRHSNKLWFFGLGKGCSKLDFLIVASLWLGFSPARNHFPHTEPEVFADTKCMPISLAISVVDAEINSYVSETAPISYLATVPDVGDRLCNVRNLF